MKLSETITYINQALNYPSATIHDLGLFLNQAISELNSELKIGLPSIEKMKSDAIDDFNKLTNVFTNSEVSYISQFIDANSSPINYNGVTYTNSNTGVTADEFYCVDVSSGTIKYYKTVAMPGNIAMWAICDPTDVDMANYLPDDWIMLFVIPYVCYKYSVRDGDTGVLFNEEFAQGYQQLRNAYTIPSQVRLFRVAHLPAYRHLVSNDTINSIVRTRAITEDMKLDNTVLAKHSSFYDPKGGWGI
jgi:hypothetical protein